MPGPRAGRKKKPGFAVTAGVTSGIAGGTSSGGAGPTYQGNQGNQGGGLLGYTPPPNPLTDYQPPNPLDYQPPDVLGIGGSQGGVSYQGSPAVATGYNTPLMDAGIPGINYQNPATQPYIWQPTSMVTEQVKAKYPGGYNALAGKTLKDSDLWNLMYRGIAMGLGEGYANLPGTGGASGGSSYSSRRYGRGGGGSRPTARWIDLLGESNLRIPNG